MGATCNYEYARSTLNGEPDSCPDSEEIQSMEVLGKRLECSALCNWLWRGGRVGSDCSKHKKGAPELLDQRITLLLAVLAAICAFAQTCVAPQKRAVGFVKAYRHLEKAIAKYRYDSNPNRSDLGKAESEGLDLLE